LCGQARDAEVAELHLFLRRHKDVPGFDVAVNDSRAVSHRERTGQVGGPGAGALHG